MMNMSRDRMWMVGCGVVSLLVVAFGYLMFISPQHHTAADLRSQADDQLSSVSLKRTHLDTLAKQNQKLPVFQAQLAADQAALPTTADIPNFLRTLQSIGSASSVSITAITISTPAGIQAVTPAPTAAAADSATSTTTTTTPVHPAAGTGGAYQIAMTISATGSVAQLEVFLTALQSQQPRAVLVSSVALTTGSTSGYSLAVSFNAFMAPSSS